LSVGKSANRTIDHGPGEHFASKRARLICAQTKVAISVFRNYLTIEDDMAKIAICRKRVIKELITLRSLVATIVHSNDRELLLRGRNREFHSTRLIL
jgi:hypothetical protein